MTYDDAAATEQLTEPGLMHKYRISKDTLDVNKLLATS